MYDPGLHQRPSAAIIDAVATHADVDKTELPPLYETIDPDSLDGLVTHWTNGASQSEGCIRFQYYGCTVNLYSDGQIVIEA